MSAVFLHEHILRSKFRAANNVMRTVVRKKKPARIHGINRASLFSETLDLFYKSPCYKLTLFMTLPIEKKPETGIIIITMSMNQLLLGQMLVLNGARII